MRFFLQNLFRAYWGVPLSSFSALFLFLKLYTFFAKRPDAYLNNIYDNRNEKCSFWRELFFRIVARPTNLYKREYISWRPDLRPRPFHLLPAR